MAKPIPIRLLSLSNLTGLYFRQGRYEEAELLSEQTLQLRRETLGETHPDTLVSLNNLAFIYKTQGRYGEAKPLLEETLQLRLETLGETHPHTLDSLNNLALLHSSWGNYREAELLYEQAFQLAASILGPLHPKTFFIQMNHVSVLVRRDKVAQAVAQLRRIEPQRLAWTGTQLYSTRAARVQSRLLQNQSSFQDVVLTLGINYGSQQALALGGDVMLRWKQLQREEQAYLARLLRTEKNPEIEVLEQDLARLRADLARLAQEEKPSEDPSAKLAELEAKELELASASQTYKRHLEVSRAGLADVQAAMPTGGVLIEFRQYQPVNFATGKSAAPRWAAMLVRGFNQPLFKDVGSVEDSGKLLEGLLQTENPILADLASAALHIQLFGAFAEELRDARTLYIASDGILSFSAVRTFETY